MEAISDTKLCALNKKKKTLFCSKLEENLCGGPSKKGHRACDHGPEHSRVSLHLRPAALATKLMDHASLQTPHTQQVHPEFSDLLIFQQATCFPSLSYFFSVLLTNCSTERDK